MIGSLSFATEVEPRYRRKEMRIENQDTSALTELTAQVVAAYIANNRVPVSELPDVIASVYATLAGLGRETPADVVEAPLVPAVPIKKSITPDYIICLDDGKQFKSLRRHLTQLGMTPDEYRRKWNLPSNYPMVAATYAAKRSEMALSFGLGRKKTEPAPVAAKRTRRKKAAEAA
jgi:predicted transcriptional regulator